MCVCMFAVWCKMQLKRQKYRFQVSDRHLGSWYCDRCTTRIYVKYNIKSWPENRPCEIPVLIEKFRMHQIGSIVSACCIQMLSFSFKHIIDVVVVVLFMHFYNPRYTIKNIYDYLHSIGMDGRSFRFGQFHGSDCSNAKKSRSNYTPPW